MSHVDGQKEIEIKFFSRDWQEVEAQRPDILEQKSVQAIQFPESEEEISQELLNTYYSKAQIQTPIKKPEAEVDDSFWTPELQKCMVEVEKSFSNKKTFPIAKPTYNATTHAYGCQMILVQLDSNPVEICKEIETMYLTKGKSRFQVTSEAVSKGMQKAVNTVHIKVLQQIKCSKVLPGYNIERLNGKQYQSQTIQEPFVNKLCFANKMIKNSSFQEKLKEKRAKNLEKGREVFLLYRQETQESKVEKKEEKKLSEELKELNKEAEAILALL